MMKAQITSLSAVLLLTTFLTLTCAAVISPAQLISPNLTSIYRPTTILKDIDEDRFEIKGRYGEDSINMISMLMNAVNGVADLAHKGFRGRIPEVIVDKLPGYQNVDIRISPALPARDIEVRIALWGLYFLAVNMVETRRFKNANYDLWWDGVIVANIVVKPHTAVATLERSGKQPLTDEEANLSLLSSKTSNPTSTLFSTPSTNTGLTCFFKFFSPPAGEPIPALEVFVTVLATLRTLAQWPSTDTVEPFRTGCKDHDVRIQFLAQEFPRTGPPFLQYGFLIDMVREIPAFMLGKRKWAELMIVTAFGREIVGTARLEKGNPE